MKLEELLAPCPKCGSKDKIAHRKMLHNHRAHAEMDTVKCETFEEAVHYCYDHADAGDAVLLSPACASWGMFPNYEERGRIFKEIVRGLEE